jgi:hypothetical protein
MPIFKTTRKYKEMKSREKTPKSSGMAPIHIFRLGEKAMSAKEWEKTEWCQRRSISASMLRTRRACGWSDKEALTVPKVAQSEIATYQRAKPKQKKELSAPEFYQRIHRMAAEWGVN